MACEAWTDKFGAAIDGELSSEAQREFDAHLHECPSCAKKLAESVQLKIAVKRAALRRYAPPAEFRQKVESQFLTRKPLRKPAWIWIPALSAAAAILIAIFWVARAGNISTSATLGEVADLHVGALASANPVDVVSTDQHTVKPWFEGKLPFAVNLPDLTNTPFTLLGGRVAYLNQAPGAGLLFQFRKHRLSVFVFQERAQWKNLSSQSRPAQRTSFWMETWTANGLRYFVIGDTSAENVGQLSALIKNAASAE